MRHTDSRYSFVTFTLQELFYDVNITKASKLLYLTTNIHKKCQKQKDKQSLQQLMSVLQTAQKDLSQCWDDPSRVREAVSRNKLVT